MGAGVFTPELTDCTTHLSRALQLLRTTLDNDAGGGQRSYERSKRHRVSGACAMTRKR